MMLRMIWRNLWRNRRRTAISMMSVAFAVTIAILFRSFQQGIFENLIDSVVGFHTGYIQIHKKGYQDEQVLGNSFVPDKDFEKSWKNSGLDFELLKRIEGYCLISHLDKTKGVMVIGTEPFNEQKLTGITARITSGNYFNEDQQAILLGDKLAEELNAHAGDTIVLLGQGYEENMAAGKFQVAGIVTMPSPEMSRSVTYLPLHAAQSLFRTENRITSAVVLADKNSYSENMKDTISKYLGDEYEVLGWKEMMPEIENHMRADRIFFRIDIGILYLVIGFGIFGTLLMMTNERRNENGMLLAIGMKKKILGAILFGETVLIGTGGALIGMLICLPITFYLSVRPIRITGELAETYQRYGFEPIFPTIVKLGIFTEQALIVGGLTILLGLYPFISILRTDPLKAIKNR